MFKLRSISTAIGALALAAVLLQAACAAATTALTVPSSPSNTPNNAGIAAAVPTNSENQATVRAEPVIYHKPASYDYSSSMMFGGIERQYYIHIPPGYDGSKPVPLVLVLCQYLGYPQGIAKITSFNDVADRHGFIVLYPAYAGKMWNVGVVEEDKNIDDAGFIRALIDDISLSYNIDSKMVYSTGLSAGAAMTEVLSCRLSDKIAAVAVVAGGLGDKRPEDDNCTGIIPAMIIHGTADPIMPFQGGKLKLPNIDDNLYPIRTLVDFYVARDQCYISPIKTDLPDAGVNDGTKVHMEDYRGTDNASEVLFYIVEGGGHTWPGGLQYFAEAYIGKTSKVFNASETIWQFFSLHPMK